MKRIATLGLASLLISSSLTMSTAFAFSDLEDGQAAAVNALKDRGVVSGIDSEHFAPKVQISYAQSVQMIVKALDLNIDMIRFKSLPVASGTYTNIADNAWYANAFVIAYYNGLEIPKDVNPNATVTREQFGDLLVRALEKKGNFPKLKIVPATINDENQITPEYQGALQRMLHYKIAELDKDGKFNPKSQLTRGGAAIWVYNAIRVLNDHAQTPAPAPAPVEAVSVTVEKVNDDVNKVTLSRGEKPSAGYSIDINNIRFDQSGQAVITYTLSDPQPDSMNASVITEAKAVTYLPVKYKVVTELATVSPDSQVN
ncbi:S-layer homology domain-containing protein [Paenibacillus sp. FSL H7-0331]|uniref:S-layer homology domain-containing protein n=1 Tax=Paenibacillus sp. FSL H7-0331 TaxID=1920421 RepID=UPI00096F1CB5|nr:S-layer homology domain-containing protein [Paenibacillus sp. FSL H7-0331]OMF20108.1 S-layer protein [Paenibacillus sp. FSL H7-0331]